MAVDRTRDIEINPNFFVPPGVIDVRQENKENGEFAYDSSTLADEGPILESPISTIPMPPTSFEIVEQRVRTGSDGRSVVDVVLEFADEPGVYTIEVGVTPV